MNNKVVIVKVKNYSGLDEEIKRGCEKIISYFEQSLSQREIRCYYPKEKKMLENLFFLTTKTKYNLKKVEENTLKEQVDGYRIGTCLYRIQKNISNLFFGIVYEDSGKKVLYVGEAPIQIKKGSKRLELYYQIYLKFSSEDDCSSVINNFEKLQVLEDDDLSDYMLCCENADLVKQFRYLIEEKKKEHSINYWDQIVNCNDEDEYDEDEKSDSEEENNTESELSKKVLSQHDDCIDLKQNEEFCERAFVLDKSVNRLKRTNFQRDYERIIHAKAFRRLVDKAQIFTSSKGDHYRTRMTHTMEVAQIARGIAKELDLNIELTEAIALAHDIGHTPFGHQGERTLDDILKGDIEGITVRNTESNYYGGFKHNLQGVKVVTLLEEKYLDHEGINLSYQVLEGILKHTKLLSCKSCNEGKNCSGEKGQCNKLKNDLEGFLPDYCDKEKLFLGYRFPTTLEGQVVAIADEIAQRSHDIDDALRSDLISFRDLKAYLSLDKFKELKNRIEKIEEDFYKKQEETLFLSEKDVLHGRVVSEIIAFFIEALCVQSFCNIKKYKEAYKDDLDKRSFFEKYKRVNEQLIKFDDNTNKLCKYLEDVVTKKVLVCSEVACFDNKASMIVQELFKAYYNKPLLLPQSVLRRIYKETIKQYENTINLNVSDVGIVKKEIGRMINPTQIECSEKQKEYFEKQKILVRAIVDYIAGMTDSYAVNEYNRIYKP